MAKKKTKTNEKFVPKDPTSKVAKIDGREVEYNGVTLADDTGVSRNHLAIAEPLEGGKSLVPTMAKINKKRKDFTSVSFFAGCGGASVGMKMAGFNVLLSNEFIPAAQDTYQLNHPGTILNKSDIRELDPKALLKELGLKKGELDHMDMSPPCKGFSAAGVQEDGWNKEVLYSDGVKQRVDDLFDQGIRMLKGMKPKTFTAENVSGLVRGVSRGLFAETIEDFKKAGYRVKAAMIEPVKLGVPQTRARLIIIGVRNDLKMDPVFPKPLKGRPVTVQDVLPHIAYLKTSLKSRLTYVPADRPSPTIVASDFDTGENARFSCGGWVEDDQGRRRKYTLPELRRVMCFPDDFKLSGTPRQQWERLGRSHVPLQVYHLSKAIRENVLEPYYDSKGADYTDTIK
tara:strand:- start:114671 stop:115867 length:1197 start_codon:yes stop_codon:yes gene_type:complete